MALTRHVLAQFVPALEQRLSFVALGNYPTPISAAHILGSDVFIKREDQSAKAYGGNKIRTLELLFAQAQQMGAKEIWSLGALGSNHAVAAAVHAPAAELTPCALLFAQPVSFAAAENLAALYHSGAKVWPLRNIALFPLAYAALMVRAKKRHAFVMAPGGATPLGALGHVGAALEVCQQVRDGVMPQPRSIVLPVGSTCTSAGLLVGFALAKQLGLCVQVPSIVAVRVSPWPVTARFRIIKLAQRTARLLASLSGVDVTPTLAHVPLRVDGGELGWGYGRATVRAVAAIKRFAPHVQLDTTYSAKAAASLLRHQDSLPKPVLFWSTKSSAPMPTLSSTLLAPEHLRRYVARGLAL